ncbi:MAG: ParA family protein [Oscillatoria sp. PMC 1051.18]|uniref:ParA family protein n=1 Tax=Oscillatoria salina TaxID=331517 RepID=UPI0013BB6198|nr:ParA family protein [Oscillatoria salina]MBZ8180928.1 ParA family protein [Oscillatoria salina IIICB1]MEC4895901.1 ParA family protein [Oscillatoria sp. PMC 1050.18]MEC5030406.1 ParA family protein [Oscillatoria sp. PMC 1051.18]NET91459.1 ParA family protein [Kamptonema sp. SIO1D9]
MGLVISTVNMKGGVGKTTLTVNLATCLAKNHGLRVLVIDLDTQISATLSLMSPHDFAKRRKERRTLTYLMNQVIRPNLKKKLTTTDIICPYVCNVKGLDLMPGDIELYDEYLVSEMLHQKATADGKADFDDVWNKFEKNLIKDILEPVINDYDFIIMDCAPGYNLLTRSGIVASNFYLLPARPEPLSLVGIQLLERRIAKLRENHASLNINLLGIVFILSGGGIMGRYYRQVMQRVSQDYNANQIFKNRIPLDVNVAKAVDTFKPAVLSTPNSGGAKAFARLSEELLEKLEAAKSLTGKDSAKLNLTQLE